MDKHEEKLKNVLFWALLFNALLVLGYYYFLNNIRGKQNVEFEKIVGQIKEMEIIQANHSIYKKVINETKAEREKVNFYVLNKNSVANFIEDLEMFAKHAGIELSKSVSVEKQVPQVRENMLKFSLRAKGKQKDVYYFMSILENIPYKLRFKKLAIATSDMGSVNSSQLPLFSGGTPSEKGDVWVGEANFEILSYINE